jgi:nitrate reductase beta subunit
MVDGGCTPATATAEFIITKINTSSKKNTDREAKRDRKREKERGEWIRGVSEEDKEGREGLLLVRTHCCHHCLLCVCVRACVSVRMTKARLSSELTRSGTKSEGDE